ncbi:colicin E5-related ribonuclease [Paenibacillus brevis]|nr:colicin E5-related ribonuclease [Paenibacillus brevis]
MVVTRSYLGKRGWTMDSAKKVVEKPYTTREAVNKANGNPATAYYNKAGDYVVVDNVTGELVQTSKFGDTGWIPDATIKNPYKP